MSLSKVLVTGAGGFVGGRVAHRIALGEEMDLTAMVHSPSGPGAMWLARLPAEIETGSVLDGKQVADLLADCDGVVNCAFGLGKTSVEGTRNLLEAAERVDVQSFVHLSSAVVHGHRCAGVDETAPFDPDTEYAEWKVKAERVIRKFSDEAALQPAVVRPLIVYGPYSEWVTRTVEGIREGAVLTDGGHGTLNQIYIDNLVDAILLALTDPAADGETFLAVDDEVSWRRYYDDIADSLDDHPPVMGLSRREIRARRRLRTLTDSVVPPARILRHVVGSKETRRIVAAELGRTPWAEPAFARLPERVRERVLGSLSDGDRGVPSGTTGADPPTTEEDDRRYRLPSERHVAMQSTTGTVPNRKLKDVLGWEQRVSYEDAVPLVAGWLEYENHV